jgi:iron-sulfur cluster insertion protein
VRVLIDPISLQYLNGANIDFQDGADGSRFVIRNPNAKSTCGCGSSFSTADKGETSDNSADGKSCPAGAAVHR